MGRIGRVWTWDEERAGVFFLEGGRLCHAPLTRDGHRVEWDGAAQVAWDCLDEAERGEAEAAERALR